MDDRRPWIIAAVAAGLVVLVVLIATGVFSGDEAEATEPDFSWRVWVVTSSGSTTTGPTTATTTTTQAPATTSAATTTSTTSTTARPTTTEQGTTSTTRSTTTSTSEAPTTSTGTSTSTSTTSPTTTTPPATTTVPPTTTTPPTTTAEPGLPEAPADVQSAALAFVTDFNRATEANDVDWLVERLAPQVIDVFGEDVCRGYVEDVVVRVSGLALQAPVRGPVDQVVEVPRPGEDPIVIDLRALYVADINFRFEGETRTGVEWLTLVGDPAAGAQSVAYFARCAEAGTGG